jgi:hypothetical protein
MTRVDAGGSQSEPWWQPIRGMNDKYFAGPAPGEGWREHVEQLNSRLGLFREHEFTTFPNRDLPPGWFIGDVATVPPEDWVLVFALNPRTDPDLDFYESRLWTSDGFWEYQTTWLRYWWNRSFHGPLARLAMSVLGSAPASESPREFAAERMVFAELCPYASERFALGNDVLLRLYGADIGFQIEARMTEIMLRDGKPSLVLVNGNEAVAKFEATHGTDLVWRELRYESGTKPGKMLWHRQGALTVDGRAIRIAGFPFLRKPATHNSNTEIEQLAERIRAVGD